VPAVATHCHGEETPPVGPLRGGGSSATESVFELIEEEGLGPPWARPSTVRRGRGMLRREGGTWPAERTSGHSEKREGACYAEGNAMRNKSLCQHNASSLFVKSTFNEQQNSKNQYLRAGRIGGASSFLTSPIFFVSSFLSSLSTSTMTGLSTVTMVSS